MASDNNIISQFFRKTSVRLLLFSAMVLFLASFFINLWLNYHNQLQRQSFLSQYSHSIVNAAASQLGNLIANNDYDALNSVAYDLFQQEEIAKAAIYQKDGTLIVQHSDNSIGKKTLSVVADIAFSEQKQGYLILDFSEQKIAPFVQQLPSHQFMIWLISGLIWGLMFVIFTAKTIPNFINWFKPSQPIIKAQPKFESQLLKQLLKRNLQHKQSNTHQDLLAIKADWSKLDNRRNNQLVQLFNRWLAPNDCYAKTMKQQLLILGINQTINDAFLTQIRILRWALEELKLSPTILLHTTDISSDIYQTYFQVIEPGIWLEQHLNELNTFEIDRTIELEIDHDNQQAPDLLELSLLKPLNAQQRTAIERQVRFLIN
ncbi:MAG: hypothetical protein HWD86_07840 [Kangiellaceae bacterium]|nr:hypothetical protein [Kangiellaceae bacterium]